MKAPLLCLLAACLAPSVQAYEMEDIKRIDFEVRDPDSNELFFRGYENISQEAASTRKETWYYDLQKTEVQYENVLYRNSDLRVENYRFKNPLTGEETDLQTEGGQMKIKYRPSADKNYQDGRLDWTPTSYHGKVFNNLILRNWKGLLQGQPLSFELVLPFRFQSLGFQIIYQSSRRVEGEERAIFALQPTNFLIRAVAPRLEFQYSKGDSPRIRQFTGPCTIPIKGKRDRLVNIIFSYPSNS